MSFFKKCLFVVAMALCVLTTYMPGSKAVPPNEWAKRMFFDTLNKGCTINVLKAMLEGVPELVLIENQKDANSPWRNPLYIVCRQGNLEHAQLIINIYNKITEQKLSTELNPFGKTLDIPASVSKQRLFKYINTPNFEGNTLLWLLCSELAVASTSPAVNPRSSGTQWGSQKAGWSTGNPKNHNMWDILTFLVSLGADLPRKDMHMLPAFKNMLFLAIENGKDVIFECFVNRIPSDYNYDGIKNHENKTLFEVALQKQNEKAIEIMFGAFGNEAPDSLSNVLPVTTG